MTFPNTAEAPVQTMLGAKDYAVSAGEVDQWIRDKTSGYVTLDRLKVIGGTIPLISNVMALADVFLDFKEFAELKAVNQTPDILDWANLSMDGLGVFAGFAVAPLRGGLRPIMKALAKEIKTAPRNIADALIAMLITHLESLMHAGIEEALKSFMGQIDVLIQKILIEFENLLKGTQTGLNGLADKLGIAKDAGDKYFKEQQHEYDKCYKEATDASLYDIDAKIYLGIALVKLRMAAALQAAANKLSPVHAITLLRNAAAQITQQFIQQTLNSIKNCTSFIKETIQKLLAAMAAKNKKFGQIASSVGKAGGNAINRRPRVRIDTAKRQRTKLQKPAPGCDCSKGGSTGKSGRSIDIAWGCETFTHHDFSIPGKTGISWDRVYRSDLKAYDNSHLGARWTNPYLKRIDIDNAKNRLWYHSADGRSIPYDLLQTGQIYLDTIEDISLYRASETQLILTHSNSLTEIYSLNKYCVAQEEKAVKIEKTEKETYGQVSFLLTSIQDIKTKHTTQLQHNNQGLLQIIIDSSFNTLHLNYHDSGLLHTIHLLPITQGEDGKPAETDKNNAQQNTEQHTKSRLLAEYTYDIHNDLTSATDEFGHTQRYSYHHKNSETHQQHEYNLHPPQTEESTHLIKRYTDRTGFGMNFKWEIKDTQKTFNAKCIQEYSDDNTYDIKLEWSDKLRITRVTDSQNNSAFYYYDINGYIYRIKYANGTEEWMIRDDNKNITAHYNPDGTTDQYTYNSTGDLTEYITPNGDLTLYNYDEKRRLIQTQDSGGNLWTNTYDENSNLASQTNPLNQITQYKYDKQGNTTSITDAKGGIKSFSYNALGQILSGTDCSGKTTSLKYDKKGRQVSQANALGQQTQFEYDTENNLIKITYPDQSTEQFEYDKEGRQTAYTDAKNQKHIRLLDAAGRIRQISIIDAQQNKQLQDKDLKKDLHTILHKADNKHIYDYDQHGRLISITDPAHANCRFIYDQYSRLEQEISFTGHSTQYSYEISSGRLITVTNSHANAVNYLTESLNLQNRFSCAIYDKAEQSTGLQNQDSDQNNFQETPLTQIDAQTEEIRKFYWKVKENISTSPHLAHHLNHIIQTHLEYGADGKINAKIIQHYMLNQDALTGLKAAEQKLKEQADQEQKFNISAKIKGIISRQEAQKITLKPLFIIKEQKRQDFIYNADGSLIDAKDETSHLQWYYNEVGDLITERQRYVNQDHIWQHSYDTLGNRIQTTRPDGSVIDILTYGSGHIHGIAWNGSEIQSFERDDLHREIKRHIHKTQNIIPVLENASRLAQAQIQEAVSGTNPLKPYIELENNALISKAANTDLMKETSYDDMGRIKHTKLSGSLLQLQTPKPYHQDIKSDRHTLHKRLYNYDTLGNLEQITDNRKGMQRYGYDTQSRLIKRTLTQNNQTQHEIFTFEPSGTLIDNDDSNQNTQNKFTDTYTKAAKINEAIKSYQGIDYEYDSLGRMTSRTEQSIKTSFTWDIHSRLIQSSSPGHKAEYSYDILGRRISKNIEYADSTKTTTYYGWDGDTLAFETEYKDDGTHTSGQKEETVIHYVYEAGTFIPLLQIHKHKGQTAQLIQKRTQPDIGIYAQTKEQDLIQEDAEYTEKIRQLSLLNPAQLKQEFEYNENRRIEQIITEDIDYIKQTNLNPEIREQIIKQHRTEFNQSAAQNRRLRLNIDGDGNITRSCGLKIGEAGKDKEHGEESGKTENKAYEGLHACTDLILHYHTDHLGTPQELTDAQGNMYWSAEYEAWGKAEIYRSSAAEELNIGSNIRFQGQYYDEEIKLHYNRHRYYDPHAGRFVSRDPIGLEGGMNVYAYAPNPISWIDPLGLTPKVNSAKGTAKPCYKTFYHATSREGAKSITKNGINLNKSRDDLDFGKGFYTTINKKYALEWIVNKFGGEGKIIEFKVKCEDLEKLNQYSLSTKSTDETYNFIRHHRKGGAAHSYDTVYGLMLLNPKPFPSQAQATLGKQQTSWHTQKSIDLLNKGIVK